MPEPAVIFDLIGLRPIVIEGLGADAVLSLSQRLILLDGSLSTEDAADIADQALTLAAASLIAP